MIMAESARCIFSLKKMHQDDKNTILRQTMHRVPLQEGSPSYLGLAELKGRIKKIMEEKQALGLKDLAVNGGDLIKEGIPAGKKMGAILNELFEAVTESPAMNNRETLLEVARNIYREKYS